MISNIHLPFASERSVCRLITYWPARSICISKKFETRIARQEKRKLQVARGPGITATINRALNHLLGRGFLKLVSPTQYGVYLTIAISLRPMQLSFVLISNFPLGLPPLAEPRFLPEASCTLAYI